MTQWAVFGPGFWKRNALLAAAMGSAVILLGCGGGGGGGGGDTSGLLDVCGDPLNSGTTVVCGYVVNNLGSAVPDASVTLKNNAGANVTTAVKTDAKGFYKFNVPAGATLFQVTPPSTYDPNTIQYNNNWYAYYRNAQDGNACIPALPTLTSGKDNRLANIVVVSANPPPPPVLNCPR